MSSRIPPSIETRTLVPRIIDPGRSLISGCFNAYSVPRERRKRSGGLFLLDFSVGRRFEASHEAPSRGNHDLWSAASPQELRKIVRQIARLDPASRRVDVVFKSQELDANGVLAEIHYDGAGAPVAVLRSPNSSGVDEVDAFNFAVPRQVSVTECDHVAS